MVLGSSFIHLLQEIRVAVQLFFALVVFKAISLLIFSLRQTLLLYLLYHSAGSSHPLVQSGQGIKITTRECHRILYSQILVDNSSPCIYQSHDFTPWDRVFIHPLRIALQVQGLAPGPQDQGQPKNSCYYSRIYSSFTLYSCIRSTPMFMFLRLLP